MVGRVLCDARDFGGRENSRIAGTDFVGWPHTMRKRGHRLRRLPTPRVFAGRVLTQSLRSFSPKRRIRTKAGRVRNDARPNFHLHPPFGRRAVRTASGGRRRLLEEGVRRAADRPDRRTSGFGRRCRRRGRLRLLSPKARSTRRTGDQSFGPRLPTLRPCSDEPLRSRRQRSDSEIPARRRRSSAGRFSAGNGFLVAVPIRTDARPSTFPSRP